MGDKKKKLFQDQDKLSFCKHFFPLNLFRISCKNLVTLCGHSHDPKHSGSSRVNVFNVILWQCCPYGPLRFWHKPTWVGVFQLGSVSTSHKKYLVYAVSNNVLSFGSCLADLSWFHHPLLLLTWKSVLIHVIWTRNVRAGKDHVPVLVYTNKTGYVLTSHQKYLFFCCHKHSWKSSSGLTTSQKLYLPTFIPSGLKFSLYFRRYHI